MPTHFCSPTYRLTPTPPGNPSGEGEAAVEIVYDVYAPGGNFKKSDPGDADFHVAVVDASDGSVPELGGAAAAENVPLLVAFVSPSGSVAFYNFAEISLPTDVTMG